MFILSFLLHSFVPCCVSDLTFFFNFRFESVSEFTSELEDTDDPAAYVTNLTYYHLVPFETDILDWGFPGTQSASIQLISLLIDSAIPLLFYE